MAVALAVQHIEVQLPVPAVVGDRRPLLHRSLVKLLAQKTEPRCIEKPGMPRIGECIGAQRNDHAKGAARLENPMVFSHLIEPAAPVALLAPMLQAVVSRKLVKRLVIERQADGWRGTGVRSES